MFVDTHCHLGDPAFQDDRDAVIARALGSGVGHIVVIGDNVAQSDVAIGLAEGCQQLSASAGVHPHHATEWTPTVADWLAECLASPLVVGVGEMGLDYHYDRAPREVQRLVFEAQMEIAERVGKPAIIHAREADDDVAAVLKNHPRATAILHSFSSGPSLFDTAMALGHYVSLSGMVTFRSWQLDDIVRAIPLDRLLLETDAPYLAPVPHRGHRNEPAFVADTARRVAVVRGLPLSELIRQTGNNARAVFGPRLTCPPKE